MNGSCILRVRPSRARARECGSERGSGVWRLGAENMRYNDLDNQLIRFKRSHPFRPPLTLGPDSGLSRMVFADL